MAMDVKLLRKHIADYLADLKADPAKRKEALEERQNRIAQYQGWTRERLLNIDQDGLYGYLAPLWAMLIWGNKSYAVNKLIENNGLTTIRRELAELLWGKNPVAERWDSFRKSVKGVGPAMMSELLCCVHPDECMIWNRRAYVGFDFLGVKNLPRYDYQLTGAKYVELCKVASQIAEELKAAGSPAADLLIVDFFIWDKLQVLENLSDLQGRGKVPEDLKQVQRTDRETSEFIHNEVRDKLAAIGRWLGLSTSTEVKIADGSKVDTVWESTIGNMGRVIYVFEVQTKGSIDSLMVNLLKAINNPAVQGVVAVSDKGQLETIRKHAAGVPALREKLRYWDYTEVLGVHDSLEFVNEAINRLGLVPQGF